MFFDTSIGYMYLVAVSPFAKQLIFDPISAQQVEMCADLMTTMTPKKQKTKAKKANKQTEPEWIKYASR